MATQAYVPAEAAAFALLKEWGRAHGHIINYTIFREEPAAVVEVRKTATGGETFRGEGPTVREARDAAAASALRHWADAGEPVPRTVPDLRIVTPEPQKLVAHLV